MQSIARRQLFVTACLFGLMLWAFVAFPISLRARNGHDWTAILLLCLIPALGAVYLFVSGWRLGRRGLERPVVGALFLLAVAWLGAAVMMICGCASGKPTPSGGLAPVDEATHGETATPVLEVTPGEPTDSPVAVAWRLSTDGANVVTLGADQNTLALVTEDTAPPFEDRVVALSAATGDVQWSSAFPGASLPWLPIAVTTKTVVVSVSSDDRGLCAYDKINGRLLWQASTSKLFEYSPRPYWCGDTIVVIDGHERVAGLAENDGRVLWQHTMPGTHLTRRVVSEGSRLLLLWETIEPHVIGLDCVDARTGVLLWRHASHIAAGFWLAHDEAHVYLGDVPAADSKAGGDGESLRVTCLSLGDGEPVWNGLYPRADVLVAAGGKLWGFGRTSGPQQEWRLWSADARDGTLQSEVRGKPGLELAYCSMQRPVLLDETFLILGERGGTGSDQYKSVICVDLDAGEVWRPWTYWARTREEPIGAGNHAYFRGNWTELVAVQAK